jgi:hypothetical protein
MGHRVTEIEIPQTKMRGSMETLETARGDERIRNRIPASLCYLVCFLCAAASRLASSALRQGLFNRAGFERVLCARTAADWEQREERVMG